MFSVIKTLVLSFLINNSLNVVKGKKIYNEEVDYCLIYKSNVMNSSVNGSSNDILNTNNLGFSNGLDNYSLIPNSFNTSLDVCKNECSIIDECEGIFSYTDMNTEYNTTNCRYLPEILEPSILNISSSSYLKVKHHTYSNNNHNLEGRVYDTYRSKENNNNNNNDDDDIIINSTVYLDDNHNGILDSNEYYINTSGDETFYFKNLKAGSYLVRQIIPEGCYQFYPGLYGNYLDQTSYADSYVDNVIYYYEIPHKSKILKRGGNIKSNQKITTLDYSYVLGDNPDLYFTFYPKNIIIFSFVDESIVDTEGDDIFINLYKTTHIKANVYISHNNINYYKLGILSNEKQTFDIKSTNEKIPVSFIKLEFYVDDYNYKTMYEYMNIISINGELNSIYNPSYSYHVTIPGNDIAFFYNDCHYKFSCNAYCIYNTISDNDYYSCLYGCKVFKTHKLCDCNINSEHNKNIKFKGFTFNYKSCYMACSIAIKKYIYPDYTILEKHTGYDNYDMSTDINYTTNTEECLDTMIKQCNDNNCSSFSFLNNANVNQNLNSTFYTLPYYKESYNHNLIINSKYSDDLSYYAPTTTITSTTSTNTTTTTDTTTTLTNTTTTTTTTSTDTTTTLTDTTTTATDTTTTATDTTDTTTTATTTTDTMTTDTTTATTTVTISTTTITYQKQLSYNNKNNKTYLYYTIPIIVLASLLFLIMVIVIIIKYKNTKNSKKQTHDYSFSNPLYYSNNSNTSNTSDNLNNTPEEEQYNYQDLNENGENNENHEYNESYINVLPTINTEPISSDL